MGNSFVLSLTCTKKLNPVSFNSNQSDFFQSFRGVCQGENLSPVLFALFLNDLDSFLISKKCPGIDTEFASDDVCFTLCRRHSYFCH